MLDTLTKRQKYPDSVQPGVPRLRSLKKGWQRKMIGDLLCEVSRPITMDDNASYNLVTVKRARGGVVKRSTKKGKGIAVKSQFEVREGDFLISKRQIVHGACGIVPAELDGSIVSNEYSVLNCRDSLDSNFLNYLTNTNYFQQTCFHSSIGVHIEKMIFKLSDWFKWKIDIPPLAEQQEMAAFVGAVDKKLEVLRRKHELLRTYKRGLMQKIFSQELRFNADDGTEFTEWKKFKLGEVVSTFSGGTPVSANPVYYGKGYPFIKSGEIGATDTEQQITALGLKNSSAKLIKKGDLLYALYGATSGEAAISNIDGAINQAILCVRTNQNKEFLYHYLCFEKKQIKAVYLQGGQGNLSAEIVKSLKINIPSLAEQQKIADFLSAIDAKIDAVSDQIEKMKQFKKGLLQQMFV